ncbi:hypothetical protein [Streptomyces sp. NPDC050264]|uniref:hypothetical protein n=1 Tax=Streptomyces sp. NPDC050264 TaxID=3155038 RepID=UPI0034144A2E
MSRTTDTALTPWPLVALGVSALDPAAGARCTDDPAAALAWARRQAAAAAPGTEEER